MFVSEQICRWNTKKGKMSRKRKLFRKFKSTHCWHFCAEWHNSRTAHRHPDIENRYHLLIFMVVIGEIKKRMSLMISVINYEFKSASFYDPFRSIIQRFKIAIKKISFYIWWSFPLFSIMCAITSDKRFGHSIFAHNFSVYHFSFQSDFCGANLSHI